MPIFKLLTNRLRGDMAGSLIPSIISALESDIAGLIGANLDVPYNDRIVALREEGVTGGNNHNHDGINSARIDHNSLLNKGSKTHAEIDAHINAAAPHSGHERIVNKGVAGGYCPLDSAGKIPQQHLPTISVSTIFMSGRLNSAVNLSFNNMSGVMYFPIGDVYTSTAGDISYNNGIVTINNPGVYCIFSNIFLRSQTGGAEFQNISSLVEVGGNIQAGLVGLPYFIGNMMYVGSGGIYNMSLNQGTVVKFALGYTLHAMGTAMLLGFDVFIGRLG